MYCIKCGSKIDDEAHFCPNCGQKVIKEETITKEENTEEEIAKESKPRISRRYKIFSIVGASLALISVFDCLLLVCLIFIKTTIASFALSIDCALGSAIAVVLSVLGLKATDKKYSIFGIIVGAICFVIHIGFMIFFAVSISAQV